MTTSRKDERLRSIDENLRKVFDETLEEGVPDRFRVLLEQLKSQDAPREADE
ncbi:MAG: NepR family anti-sigma factor [Pseudomonadota bacterium]